jgi:ribonuclease D
MTVETAEQPISTEEDLKRFLGQFDQLERPLRCAIDTEADSLHSYQEKLCLIQFGCQGVHALIDPLSIKEMSGLIEFVDRAETWMHGADFDMWMFRKAYDWIPPLVYDTQVAARLIGYEQFGLARMVEEHFDVVLSKASQRADWGKRPLGGVMREYALNDVRYVIPLADLLMEKIRELGREPWFEESCMAARHNVLGRTGPDSDEVWRITGWGKLQPRGLAYLREIWGWRDSEAERMNRPPFKVIVNEQILSLAIDLYHNKEVELPQRFSLSQQRRLARGVERARKLPESELPHRRTLPRRQKPPNLDEAVNKLKRKRDAAAKELNLDPTLIATRGLLEAIATDEEAGMAQLMDWQRELMCR